MDANVELDLIVMNVVFSPQHLKKGTWQWSVANAVVECTDKFVDNKNLCVIVYYDQSGDWKERIRRILHIDRTFLLISVSLSETENTVTSD